MNTTCHVCDSTCTVADNLDNSFELKLLPVYSAAFQIGAERARLTNQFQVSASHADQPQDENRIGAKAMRRRDDWVVCIRQID